MPLPRRLRSFSLRTLMVLVTLLCVSLAFVASKAVPRNLALRRWAATGAVELQTVAAINEVYASAGEPRIRTIATTIPWYRKIVGDEDVWRIRFYAWGNPSPDEIESARRLFPEASVEQWFDGKTGPSAPYGFPQPPRPATP